MSPGDSVVGFGKEFGSELSIAIAKGVREALKTMGDELDEEVAKKLKNIAKTRSGENLRPYQKDANEAIAEQMRTAVVERYDEERERHRELRDTEPYRIGSGREGGAALRAALHGEAVARAGYDGIGFINTTLLYEASSFWRRLNFGSGTGTVGLPPLSFTVFGQNFSSAPHPVRKGSPNTMPPGFWYIDQTSHVRANFRAPSDVFFPNSKLGTEHFSVREIQPWSFLDAGIERFNEVAGVEYSHMVDRIINDKLKKRGLD